MRAATASIVAATAAAVLSTNVAHNMGQHRSSPAVFRVASTCSYRDGGALPDPKCTPGAINHAVTQRTIRKTICKPGWATSVRPPETATEPLKFKAMRAYGDSTAAGQAGRYEYDHLIPIELGGALLDTRNLWPEQHAGTDGSYAKDVRENRLRVLVCVGAVKLAAARRIMRTDWRQPLP